MSEKKDDPTGIKTLAEQRLAIVTNWDSSGLLDGLSGMKKSNIAELLEGQASDMLNEVTVDPKVCSSMSEGASVFPMAVRVAAQTIACDLVAVQPMSAPSITGKTVYKKKPRVPRKMKKDLKSAFGDKCFKIWLGKKTWDKPYKNSNKDVGKVSDSGSMFMDFVYG